MYMCSQFVITNNKVVNKYQSHKAKTLGIMSGYYIGYTSKESEMTSDSSLFIYSREFLPGNGDQLLKLLAMSLDFLFRE